MSIDLKALVKQHVSVNSDNSTAVVTLVNVQEGEWQLARKSEYKRDVFSIPDSELFLEVCLVRSGTYHSGYTYGKPKFSLVSKTAENVVSYHELPALKDKAEALKSAHFDDDDTQLVPVYASGWVSGHKANTYETVYDIGGVLFKQTLYGNSDWTEFVDYAIVERIEETVVSYE